MCAWKPTNQISATVRATRAHIVVWSIQLPTRILDPEIIIPTELASLFIINIEELLGAPRSIHHIVHRIRESFIASKVSSNFSNDNNTDSNTYRLFTIFFCIRILFYVGSLLSSFSSFIVATFIIRVLLSSNWQLAKHVASSFCSSIPFMYIHNESSKGKKETRTKHCIFSLRYHDRILTPFELRHPNKRQCTTYIGCLHM